MTVGKRFAALSAAALLLSASGCAAPTPESRGQAIEDSVITTRIRNAIYMEPSLKLHRINVETHRSAVLLTGSVRSQAEVEKAAELAQGVEGVSHVRNDIRLR
jgi:osmotically-inducible protein OsmY